MKNTKRFMALLLTLVLVFGSMSSAFAAEVNEDVVDTDYEVAVGKLSAVGIMGGYPDGTFRPEAEITRAEFAKIAVLALGLNDAADVSKTNTVFTDVDAFHWAAGYINVAVDRGILKGYPDGTYKPSNPLSNAEAITILTRLVGLAPVVDKQGNWPANYITQANILGIMDDVVVSSTSNATRGNAAKMLVNTLTVQKWGATGYNNDGSVQYGQLEFSDETEKNLLNDNLDIMVAEDVVFTDKDVDENELTVTFFVEDRNEMVANDVETFELADNTLVDLYEAYLNEGTIWVNKDDEIIFIDITSDYFIDAIELDDDKLELVEHDKKYDFEQSADNDFEELDGAVTFVDGDLEKFADGETYTYAKVVLDSRGDVAAVDAYNLDEFIIAEEVDGDVVVAVDGEEVDFEDYTIVKDGKYASVKDVEEGDIVFFDNGAEFAEIYTKAITGEIETVYSDSFIIDDEEYDYVNDVFEGAYYLDGDDLEAFDDDVADGMKDEEEDVTIYLARNGEVVFVSGDKGDAVTNTVAGLLLEPVAFDKSFDRVYGEFIFVNEEGTKVTETIRFSSLDQVNGRDVDGVDSEFKADEDTTLTVELDGTDYDVDSTERDSADAGAVVEFVYDEDGSVVELNFMDDSMDARDDADGVKTDDKYVDGEKFASNTVVFVVDGGIPNDKEIDKDDVKAVEWSEIKDFEEILDGRYYANDDKVEYVVALDTDSESDYTYVNAVLDSTRRNKDDEIVKLTAWTTDGKTTYVADAFKQSTTDKAIYVLKVNDDTEEVDAMLVEPDGGDDYMLYVTEGVDVTDISTKDDTINGKKLIKDAIILDATGDIEEMNLRDFDLEKNEYVIDIVFDTEGDTYVEIVIVREINEI